MFRSTIYSLQFSEIYATIAFLIHICVNREYTEEKTYGLYFPLTCECMRLCVNVRQQLRGK